MDPSKISAIILAFASAVRLPADLPPSEWSSRVKIQDGLSPEFDITQAPWLREPLDAFANPDAREIVVMAPVGTGKTTLIEAGLCYIVSEDPGPTLIVAQTDSDLQDWSETRLDFAFRNTDETKRLYPKDRHKAAKMKILFPHMSLFMTGANMSGLQSKSMRRVICDEVWQWRPGRVREAKGRLHDRWNRQIYLMSQGGIAGDDLDTEFKSSNQSAFSFCCPKCARVQPWRMENLRWDTKGSDEKRDNLETAKTARYHCENPECDYVLPDSPVPRRELAQSARYVQTEKGNPGVFGYRYNVLANWRKPFWEIVLEWLAADDEKRKGNIEPLKQFIQKRLAESWEERIDENIAQLSGAGYSMAEYANGEMIDGEAHRNMTIDRQQDHFWARVRAFRANGDNRLIWAGKVNTEEMLRDIQLRLKVPDRVVGIDARFDSAYIYDLCAKYDWTALMGDKETEYPHRDKQGKTTKKVYSAIQHAYSVKHQKNVRLMLWTNGKVKDILHRLRQGQTDCAFEIPDDCPPEWHEHMLGEHKKEIVGKGDNQIEYRWVRIGKRDNHLWDCESMGIALAMAVGVFAADV